MAIAFKARQLPQRLAAGAFILNSGLSKRDADEGTADFLHKSAITAFPQFEKMAPQQFAKLLSTSEIALGAALLAPFVPTVLAASGLTLFSGALVRMYLRTPGATEEGSIAPTGEGLSLAKDSWLLGMGVGMLIDALTTRSSDTGSDRENRDDGCC